MIFDDAVRAWLTTHGLRIFVILAAVAVARLVLSRVVPPALRHTLLLDVDEQDRAETLKRSDTLSAVILRSAAALTMLVAVFFILGEVGFNIAPVIAGLGISGIALGLGAQTLVKDGINGCFILGENQFARGDTVTVAGVSGHVEEVNLRRTVLRADDGTLYTVPNSAIIVAGNHTRGHSGIYFTLGISYLADLARTIREIDRIGAELAASADFGPLLLESPRVLRVESLEDTYLNLRITGRVIPGAQGQVAGELRRRLKEEFDRLGIAYRGSLLAGTTPVASSPPAPPPH